MASQEANRLIVAMTGASGALYGVRLLERALEIPLETHFIATRWAQVTLNEETDYRITAVRHLAHTTYSENDQSAQIASGSFITAGMVIAPCSAKTLAALASGFAYNLVCRAADVVLKERRKLVLVVREAPLSGIQLRNMLTLADAGAIIFPPVPAFYGRPQSVEEVVDYTVVRILDQFGFSLSSSQRWTGREGG